MKYLIYTLALISAFFVSADVLDNLYDMNDLKQPKSDGLEICITAWDNHEACGRTKIEAQNSACEIYKGVVGIPSNTSSRIYTRSTCDNPTNNEANGPSVLIYGKKKNQFTESGWTEELRLDTYSIVWSNQYERKSWYCPPQGFPEHDNSVAIEPAPTDPLAPTFMCAKLLTDPNPEPDPDEKCDEFGNNSFLPHKSGVGQAGETACYANPATGLQCQYEQGHDNFTATGKNCDGDENDYGDKPTPEPTPDGGDDNCYNYGSQGQVLICDVDPNEGCNAIVVSGQQQYQCPHGCGSMDGVYFCTYDDKDGDGIPDDKNENGVPDKDETCVNGKCKPKNPDDNTTPTPEAPDMTQTNTRLDSVIGELDSIGGKINKTNQTLDGINSGVQGIKQGQDKSNGLLTGVEKNTKLTAENTDVIAGNTKGILDSISETDIGDSFNPEGSSSFYESAYENGWQGVWDEKSDLIGQTGLFVFLKQFRFSSGGSAPDMNICFDVLVNLGCKTLDPNWERLMPFLRICIFITAAFVCRRIIFGG